MNLNRLILLILGAAPLMLSGQKTISDSKDQTYFHEAKHGRPDHVCKLQITSFERNRIIPFSEKSITRGKSGAPPAVFDVDYFGFTEEAQTALEYAFNTLSNLITSPVPIEVSATYSPFDDPNVLGAARPGTYFFEYGNWYAAPLAEKIAGRDFGGEDDYDIVLQINSEAPWHFDPTDGSNIGSNFDLATIMMHEIIHGLGFTGFARQDSNNESLFGIRIQDEISIYDEFLEDNNAVPLKDVGPDGSDELSAALRSTRLFFNGPTTNTYQEVYAPVIWESGSSIYHLNEGDTAEEDLLMTPRAARGEINSDPGVAVEMLKEMGWDFTSIAHERTSTYTENLSEDLLIDASIFTDSGFDTSSVKLIYSRDTFNLVSDTVEMVYNAQTDKFEALIPAPNEEVFFQYKIELNQNNRVGTISAPAFLVIDHYNFNYVIDNVPPVISHNDLASINSSDLTVDIKAFVVDSFATSAVAFNASAEVDTVVIEYAINNGNVLQQGAILSADGFGEFYVASISLDENLTSADMLQYRIIATDASQAANQAIYPSNGSFIEVPVIDVLEPAESYINDFNDSDTGDFNMDRFEIGTVTGFNNDGGVLLNQDHPYRTAGNNSTANFTAFLKVPIIIAADSASAFIKFKEIVLVEPGDPGAVFGDTEFWDYVIVEAKPLSGGDWVPLLDGYDANEVPAWVSRYNSLASNGTSRATPTPVLWRNKELSFLGGESPFSPQDTVLVRFRLFSDPFASGWGWMLDNLNIQNADVNVAIEDFIEEERFDVYPNPSGGGDIFVRADLTKPSFNLTLNLFDVHGRMLRSSQIQNGLTRLNEEINMSDLEAGVYLVVIQDNESTISKKVVHY